MAARLLAAVFVLVGVHIGTGYFGPHHWGLYVTASSLIVLLGVIEDFGLETFLTRQMAVTADEAANLFGSGLGLRLALSCAAAAVAAAIGIIAFRQQPELLDTLLLLLPVLAADAAASAAGSVFRAAGQLAAAGVSEILTALATAISALVARSFGLDLAEFALAVSVGSLAAAGVGLALAARLLPVRGLLTTRAWARLIRRAWPLGLVLVVSVTYAQIDTLLLAALRPAPEVAFYGIAVTIGQFAGSLPSFLMAAFLPDLSRTPSAEWRPMVEKTFGILLLLVLPPLVAGICLAPSIVDIVAGRAFAAAWPPLVIMLAGLAASLPTAAMGNALVAAGEERGLMKVGLLVLCANISLNLAIIPPAGSVGAAAALLGSELVALAATAVLFRSRYGWLPRPPHASLAIATAVAPALLWVSTVPTGVIAQSPRWELGLLLPVIVLVLCAIWVTLGKRTLSGIIFHDSLPPRPKESQQ